MVLASFMGLVSCATHKESPLHSDVPMKTASALPSHIELIAVNAPGTSATSFNTIQANLQHKGWQCTANQETADAILNISLSVSSGQLNTGRQVGPLVGLALLPAYLAIGITEGLVTGQVKDYGTYGAGGNAIATLIEGGTGDQLWQQQAKVHIDSPKTETKATEPAAEADLIRQLMAAFPSANQ